VNPYLPPSTPPSPPTGNRSDDAIADVKAGRRCEKCGSTNTSAEEALRGKPSVLAFLLFGWIFLLIRTAFSKQREYCHDCGAIRAYKTMGSKVAMVFLLLVAFVFAITYLASLQSP
jgi:uncharacterized protein (DUF983 family)